MPKLNQIIAIAAGKKTNAQQAITVAHHKVLKTELLSGLARVYKPLADDGETLPSETKLVQYRVTDAISDLSEALTDLFDIIATQEFANRDARADVVIEDTGFKLENVPVTYLLFLEKQLTDIHTFVEKLPVLDPGIAWHWDSAQNCYSAQHETNRNKKEYRAFEKSPATDKHPAQVDTYQEDVKVGTWMITTYSGAIPATRKKELLQRVRQLQEAVKEAREEANMMEVQNQEIGAKVFEFLFR